MFPCYKILNFIMVNANINANKLQYIKNFSRLYDRMQLIKSDYIPNDYKSMLFQYLEQRESVHLSEYNLTLEDVDENLEVFESCLRDTMNSIKWSYSICQIAVGLMKKFSMDKNLVYVLENYKFERHFEKYFKNIESRRPVLPDDHFLTVPLAIIMDIFQHILSNNMKEENSIKEAQRKLELEKLNEKFKVILNKATLRGMSEIKRNKQQSLPTSTETDKPTSTETVKPAFTETDKIYVHAQIHTEPSLTIAEPDLTITEEEPPADAIDDELPPLENDIDTIDDESTLTLDESNINDADETSSISSTSSSSDGDNIIISEKKHVTFEATPKELSKTVLNYSHLSNLLI